MLASFHLSLARPADGWLRVQADQDVSMTIHIRKGPRRQFDRLPYQASFISSLIRCTVPTPRPSSFATLMMPFPERSALRAAVFAASSILGRPRVVPFA